MTGAQEVRILQLEAKLDDLEQYGRRNSVRISGIEEDVEGEDLAAKVKNVLTVFGLENSVQIDRLHRVGPRNFFRINVPGDCSLVRRFCSPKVRKSEIKGSSFRRFCSPKVRNSDDDFYSVLL